MSSMHHAHDHACAPCASCACMFSCT